MTTLGQNNIEIAIAVEVANACVSGSFRKRFERNNLERTQAVRTKTEMLFMCILDERDY